MKRHLLLEVYNPIHHYDLICVSETYLDSSISNDEKDISIVRADIQVTQSDVIDGVHIIDIPNLTESILSQATTNNKTDYILVVYRIYRLILGYFNSRSNSWWDGDISTKEGIDLDSVSSSHGFTSLPEIQHIVLLSLPLALT